MLQNYLVLAACLLVLSLHATLITSTLESQENLMEKRYGTGLLFRLGGKGQRNINKYYRRPQGKRLASSDEEYLPSLDEERSVYDNEVSDSDAAGSEYDSDLQHVNKRYGLGLLYYLNRMNQRRGKKLH